MIRNQSKQLRIWKTASNRKPVVLLGARQVGKTYLLKEFGQKEFNNFIYLNFESDSTVHSVFSQDLDPKRILLDLERLGHKVEIGRTLLIFDEIQSCPRALTSLKYFCEQIPELHICAAGSLLGLYLAEGSFPVGKVDLLYVYPLTFAEFLLGINEEQLYQHVCEVASKQTSWSSVLHPQLFARFKDYLIVGGLPEVVVAFSNLLKQPRDAYIEVRRLQNQLVIHYLADVAKHSGKVNAMHIERVWINAAVQLAHTQDGKSDKFKFKGVVANIRGYERLAGAIDWLEKAGLILRVPICKKSASPLRAYTEDSVFKLYLFDVGLLGVMTGLSPETVVAYDFGSYKGYLAENFVAQELTTYGFDLFCWRERESEVDFLIDSGVVGLVPLEVKSGNSTKAKSLGVYVQKYKPTRVVKISGRYELEGQASTLQIPLYGLNGLDDVLRS